MPGITGIIGAAAPDGKAQVQQMVKAMLHERFYKSGQLHQPTCEASVGWVNHPDGFDDGMPLWNEARNVALVFSGEHFGDADTLAEHARDLLGMYERRGIEFLKDLNGIFSGVLLDLRESKVVLFNDRFGLGRIYWHQANEGIYFASEAKALLRVRTELRALNTTALAEYFSCGCPLEDRTLFPGISLLPPASMWSFQPGRPVRRESYFTATEWENQSPLSEADYYETLKDTVARVLPRYFRGKQRVAVSVTGGLDSRLIMAWSPRPPYKLDCYTFDGPYRECSDVTIGREVARLCQQYHQVIPLTNKFFPEFAGLAKRSVVYTDGALDVTGAPGLFANRLAREIAPVRLTGNYGDEILRGNIAFRPQRPREALFSPEFFQQIKAVEATYESLRRGSRTSFVAFKQVPWHHYGRYALEQSQLTIRSPYLDNALVALMYRAPQNLAASIDPALRLISDGDGRLANVPTDRGAVRHSKSMATRIRSLVQGFTIRAEYAYDYGMPQWLARADRSLSRLHLEKAFLGRHKFYHFRVWYKDQLAKFVQDMLLDSRALNRSFLNPKELKRVVETHVRGRENHTATLHKLISSEILQRQLLEQK
jgi:asparagine synthase (glutamine-hydrolysing)